MRKVGHALRCERLPVSPLIREESQPRAVHYEHGEKVAVHVQDRGDFLQV
jgi:hypothetical protein